MSDPDIKPDNQDSEDADLFSHDDYKDSDFEICLVVTSLNLFTVTITAVKGAIFVHCAESPAPSIGPNRWLAIRIL